MPFTAFQPNAFQNNGFQIAPFQSGSNPPGPICGYWETLGMPWETMDVAWENIGPCPVGGNVFHRWIHWNPFAKQHKRKDDLEERKEKQRQRAIKAKLEVLDAVPDTRAAERAKAAYAASMLKLASINDELEQARLTLAKAEAEWFAEIERDDQEVLELLSLIDDV